MIDPNERLSIDEVIKLVEILRQLQPAYARPIEKLWYAYAKLHFGEQDESHPLRGPTETQPDGKRDWHV